jgi:Fur family peroxide stress response transcriptional regulator
MTRAPSELKEMLANFASVLRTAGYKLTPQRLEIYRRTAASAAHPDIETIHRGVRKAMPSVSLDTVYRTLELFRELGLVSSLRPHPGPVRFDANVAPHHHFVCNLCGLTLDFACQEFDALEVPASAQAPGRVESAHVEVRGLCRVCAEAAAPRPAHPTRPIGTKSHRD